MADQTTRDAAEAKPGNGGQAMTDTDRSLDPRNVEIVRLKKERDEWRARERLARAEVDQLHERLTLLAQASKRFATSMRSGTIERQNYRRRIAAQYAVSRVVAAARDLDEAAPEILRILGEQFRARTGALWTLDGDNLRHEIFWRSQAISPDPFEEACRRTSFSRGVGLPGRAWSMGEPVSSQNLLEEDDPLREAAAEEGLRGAIAFPVRDGRLVGVFELFSAEELTPSEDLLQTTVLVGRQIGQFVERRRAEKQRDRYLVRERQARRELSGILESISDAFFAVDREWRFTYVNSKAEQFWSRTKADLLGKNMWEEFPQAADSEAFREIHRAMAEGVTTSFEAISPVISAFVSGSAYPSSEGVSVYLKDITDRKKAEEALRESEERYRTLFESIDEGFCIVEVIFDADGEPVDYRFLETNPAFEKQTGLRGATGKRMRELAPDHEVYWFEFYGRVASTGESVRFVREAKALGGRWFDVYAFRLGDWGSRRVAIVFNDVTERKQAEEALRESEERLQRAIAIETVGVIFFRADGQITEANDAFLRLSGYSREDLAEGLLRWDAMTPPDWMPRSLEAIEELQTTGRTTPYEKEHIHRDGSRWWGLFAATRLNEEESAEFVIDITEHKRAEEEREQLLAHELTTRAQTEERRRLSRELHDRVAHDMALVHQSLELYEVLNTKDPARAATKMEVARETVKRALNATRNLSMELRQREVGQSLEAALSDLLGESVPPNIAFELSSEGEERTVPAEARSQLFLILREAIRNAVTHSGCRRITVRSEILPEVISGYVEDDGCGFDAQTSHPADRNGLRSMEERAALLGGTLDVSSSPGKGTTVRVSIPLGAHDGG